MKALDKFDYKKGYKTISYSVWWIKQSIIEALKERATLEGESLPCDFEPQGSFESEDYDSDLTVDEAYIEVESDLFKMEEIKNVTSLLISCLSNREMYVISEYYGINKNDSLTLEEIGTKLGLTKERIRQIKEKALKKLRYEALRNSITSDIYK
jgi:RNA polymerase primary sigma factor